MKAIFIYDRPVPPELFIDRTEILEKFRRLFQLFSIGIPFSVAIISPFKHGKTSLIMKLMQIIKDEFPNIIGVYISLKKSRNFPLALILEFLSIICKIPTEQLFTTKLKEPLLEKLRETAISIRNESIIKDELLVEWIIKDIDKYINKKGKRLVLFLDEFHLLEKSLRDYKIELPYDFLRAVLEETRISLVVAGSMVKQMHEAIEPWGGRFLKIYLSSLDKNETIKEIVRRFKMAEIDISEDFARKIYNSTGGHPFYINIVCSEILSRKKADDETLHKALEELHPILNDRFSTYLTTIKNEIGEKAIEIIRKVIKEPQITNKLSLHEKEILEKLIKCGILGIKNSKYFVLDPLFERYILGLKYTTQIIIPLVNARDIGEHIVSLDLLRQGYIPFASYLSRGAFDIEVHINKKTVGIQVKRRSSDVLYLSDKDIKKIENTTKKTGAIPVIAFVKEKDLKFSVKYFPFSGKKYEWNKGFEKLSDIIKTYT